jgi:MOSC domain-containing protein YiiM
MSLNATIVGVFCGAVSTFTAPDSRLLTTAIRKTPVADGFLDPSGFHGDASSEADHHSPDKAVHLFADESYHPVEARLGLKLPRPAFGENLTATGIGEERVCVGDRYEIGAATICVTQPTERCRTIGRSLGAPRVLKVLHELELCGFYARVIEPGRVAAGDPVRLRARPRPDWPIRRLHRLMFQRLTDDRLVAEAMEVGELSIEWKLRVEVMRGRFKRGEPLNSSLAEL